VTEAAFARWVEALQARHMADLQFAEVSRALRALSATYVEKRRGIGKGAALAGAGKRAAFALFYGPLHYLLIRHITDSLAGATSIPPTLIDLGCGTGAAGAAWAASCRLTPKVLGIDRHHWAVQEASWTYRFLGLRARAHLGDLAQAKLPNGPAAILAAFAINELTDAGRDVALARLLERHRRGDAILVVEPLARFVAPWWSRWRAAFEARGGRADEWRVRADLPAMVALLDQAAGLDHREITGRSLWMRPGSGPSPAAVRAASS
jgi:hypothetical protein